MITVFRRRPGRVFSHHPNPATEDIPVPPEYNDCCPERLKNLADMEQ